MAGGANRLSSASARGDLAEVEMLLQNGADVNANNVFGRTPLQVGKAFYMKPKSINSLFSLFRSYMIDFNSNYNILAYLCIDIM